MQKSLHTATVPIRDYEQMVADAAALKELRRSLAGCFAPGTDGRPTVADCRSLGVIASKFLPEELRDGPFVYNG